MQKHKQFPAPDPSLDPAQRAKVLRELIDKGKIKPNNIVNETLALLDQMVALEAKGKIA
jgi:predicted oxidoreductase